MSFGACGPSRRRFCWRNNRRGPRLSQSRWFAEDWRVFSRNNEQYVNCGEALCQDQNAFRFLAARPTTYFTDGEVFPETVKLCVSPVVAKAPSGADVFHRVTQAIQQAVARARNAILACGRMFVGQAGVLSHSFRKRAESFEPRRGPIPKVRARNRPLLRAMLARNSVFWAEYRAALEAWRGGDRGVVFPFGTWGMRVFHSAVVASG